MLVEYSSNNSGGFWWLKDEDWYALEKAGWQVEWFKDSENNWGAKDGRFLGSLACYAKKEFPTIAMAKAEWEYITSQNAEDKGCSCCGQPHYFSATDENGNWVADF